MVNVALWVIAGGALGWLGYAFMEKNVGRGAVISVVIGAVGGFVGGNMLAPMFGAVVADPGDFRPFALAVAVATAIACVTISDMVYERYGM